MRRHITSFVLLFVLGGIVLAEYTNILPTTVQSQIVTTLSNSKNYLESALDEYAPKIKSLTQTTNSATEDSTKQQSATSQDKQTGSTNGTPAFSMVNKFVLGNVYYYHFTNKTPKVARQAFNDAIYAYNQTGVVKLIEGKGNSSVNTITFSIYHKDEGQRAQTLELGTGGPELTYKTNDPSKSAINHASAKINMNYPESVSDSVTMHELGHALGLNHSTDTSSIMYPTNQGVKTLSSYDITGLKSIYNK
ncbi:matrixin family metalloprotease [Companilactobacillus sp. HBUAS59699]|uniref:matrixin family metalloprotease n=1 Tax=Companilactobacillus sp. HBUAS59699 TaxID=3109358 RepID=UPI002FEEF252